MRMRQLEQVQQRFAMQQKRVVEIEQLIDQIRQQVRDTIKAKPEETIEPIIAQQRFRYVQYLKQQAEHLGEALRHENKVLEKIREEMRLAHVKKRSLELLEEKQRKAYIQHIQSQEEKEMEDLVVARMSRR
jgi:flagellar export protein FliJ